ncbi:mitochondrial genome maintenance MGM101-domain-containing protein [Elsinoe ampelina]|uniref:Mitochondrial genome maintenance protein MGM101 n=1 Tax=Elsinoe ampelina TaxID=302913 RepID=A0A6A6GJA6_9PEZI|nr:mitochondrial genome maintenance MGM101-domain-containing protein [Elsinoe ampelina]
MSNNAGDQNVSARPDEDDDDEPDEWIGGSAQKRWRPSSSAGKDRGMIRGQRARMREMRLHGQLGEASDGGGLKLYHLQDTCLLDLRRDCAKIFGKLEAAWKFQPQLFLLYHHILPHNMRHSLAIEGLQALSRTHRQSIFASTRLRQPITTPIRTITTTRSLRAEPTPQTPPVPTSNPASTTSPSRAHNLTPTEPETETRSLTDSLADPPPVLSENEKQVDWTRSYHGLSASPFSPEQNTILQQPIDADDIEVKPDGIIYLPEIKYRRILNKAFGPGGWGLAPRGETIVTQKLVTREYALVAAGRLVSIARGEQQYFDAEGIPTATEGCKSNALMRCCKDLGIASELWDPRFIRGFLKEKAKETIVEHQVTKKRRKHWMRKDDVVKYPFKEVQLVSPVQRK